MRRIRVERRILSSLQFFSADVLGWKVGNKLIELVVRGEFSLTEKSAGLSGVEEIINCKFFLLVASDVRLESIVLVETEGNNLIDVSLLSSCDLDRIRR